MEDDGYDYKDKNFSDYHAKIQQMRKEQRIKRFSKSKSLRSSIHKNDSNLNEILLEKYKVRGS